MSDLIVKSRSARTRGADLWSPQNRTPVPKIRRTINDLLTEHRLQMLGEAKELGRQGATLFEVAEHFGVSQNTILAWKARDPAFESALELGNAIADKRVEAALFDRAVGYSYRSEEIRTVDGAVVRVPVIKHEPPNIQAIQFWLKNRKPQHWRDQQTVDVNANVNVAETDPRKLAMAVLQIMREAVNAPKTIDNDEADAK